MVTRRHLLGGKEWEGCHTRHRFHRHQLRPHVQKGG